ncbi:MAG: HAD family hydrolase [Candidatus Binataceae bacterium]|nr:HAD family hydrolase [Candidatus Binataceae bacterium]
MRATRTLLFDFGGTLDCPRDAPRHWLDRFLVHYRGAGLDLTRDQLDLGFAHATRVAYRSTASIRHFGLAELVTYLVRLQIGHLRRAGSAATRDAIEPVASGFRLDETVAWIAQSFIAETTRGMAESRAVLARLAPRFRLGVVSNFYGNLDRVIREAGLSEYFGAIVDSSRIGIFKPAPGIFIAALERLGVAAGAAAMVGDSLDKDCAPAHALGLATIWLRATHDANETGDTRDAGTAQGSRNRGGVERGVADFTIETLAELEGLTWWTE